MEPEAVEAAASGPTDPAPAVEGSPGAPWFEQHRSDVLAPDLIRMVADLHQIFARQLARSLGNALRTPVRVEGGTPHQRLYRAFSAALPSPVVASPVALEPLPGGLVVALAGTSALCLVERLMGGPGNPGPARGLTDLELLVMGDFFQLLLAPLQEAFEPVLALSPSLTAIETNPALIRLVPPLEMTMYLSQTISFPGTQMPDAILLLCYPVATLRAALAPLLGGSAPLAPRDAASAPAAIAANLAGVGVEFSVHLKPLRVPAGDLVGLKPGDVLRLEHKTDEPAVGAVRGIDLLTGSLGTRGRLLGFRVATWRNPR